MDERIEKLRKQAVKCLKMIENDHGHDSQVWDIEEYFEALEAAQPRWISVKERLPEPNQLVVILYRDQKPFNNRNPPTYFGRHTGKYWYEALDHSDVAWNTKLQPITHWLEIPAAPEVKEG